MEQKQSSSMSIPINGPNWADSDFDSEETETELESGTEDEGSRYLVWTSVSNGKPRRSIFSPKRQPENVDNVSALLFPFLPLPSPPKVISPSWIIVREDEQIPYQCKFCKHQFREEDPFIYYHQLCEFFSNKPQQNSESIDSSILDEESMELKTELEPESKKEDDTFSLCSKSRELSLKREQESESEDNVDDDTFSLCSSENGLFPLPVSNIQSSPDPVTNPPSSELPEFTDIKDIPNLGSPFLTPPSEMDSLGLDEGNDCQSQAPSSSNPLDLVSLDALQLEDMPDLGSPMVTVPSQVTTETQRTEIEVNGVPSPPLEVEDDQNGDDEDEEYYKPVPSKRRKIAEDSHVTIMEGETSFQCNFCGATCSMTEAAIDFHAFCNPIFRST